MSDVNKATQLRNTGINAKAPGRKENNNLAGGNCKLFLALFFAKHPVGGARFRQAQSARFTVQTLPGTAAGA